MSRGSKIILGKGSRSLSEAYIVDCCFLYKVANSSFDGAEISISFPIALEVVAICEAIIILFKHALRGSVVSQLIGPIPLCESTSNASNIGTIEISSAMGEAILQTLAWDLFSSSPRSVFFQNLALRAVLGSSVYHRWFPYIYFLKVMERSFISHQPAVIRNQSDNDIIITYVRTR